MQARPTAQGGGTPAGADALATAGSADAGGTAGRLADGLRYRGGAQCEGLGGILHLYGTVRDKLGGRASPGEPGAGFLLRGIGSRRLVQYARLVVIGVAAEQAETVPSPDRAGFDA